MKNPIIRVDYDLVSGPHVIKKEDIPRPTPMFVLIKPDLGFDRDKNGNAVRPGGTFIIPEDGVNAELYQCNCGTIIAMGDLAFCHREDEELRGQRWLGTWPTVGDKVVFRGGGVAQRHVLNGIDLFSILDEDIRLLINDNIQVKGYMHRTIN